MTNSRFDGDSEVDGGDTGGVVRWINGVVVVVAGG